MASDVQILEAFHSQYIPEPNSGCWLWEGLTRSGYGLLGKGYNGSAHRFSFEHFKGPIASGLVVCHSCDVRVCVNPDHLWLGSQADNVRDCRDKKRNAHGERQGQAKLTAKTVREIRSLRGVWSQRQLAERYNVGQTTIRNVLTRFTWNSESEPDNRTADERFDDLLLPYKKVFNTAEFRRQMGRAGLKIVKA